MIALVLHLALAGREGYKPRPMLRRLLPREEDFFTLFERRAALTVEGAQQFAKLASGGQNVKALAARIKEIEHETDVITHTCVERLPSSPPSTATTSTVSSPAWMT
jgi:hypothetical protein